MSLETEIINFLQEPERKERMLKAAEEALHQKVTENFRWSLPDSISKVCNEFVETEVAPKVREHLLANKGAIIEAAKAAADDIGKKLAEQMVARAEKNLDGYSARALIEGMFK